MCVYVFSNCVYTNVKLQVNCLCCTRAYFGVCFCCVSLCGVRFFCVCKCCVWSRLFDLNWCPVIYNIIHISKRVCFVCKYIYKCVVCFCTFVYRYIHNLN